MNTRKGFARRTGAQSGSRHASLCQHGVSGVQRCRAVPFCLRCSLSLRMLSVWQDSATLSSPASASCMCVLAVPHLCLVGASPGQQWIDAGNAGHLAKCHLHGFFIRNHASCLHHAKKMDLQHFMGTYVWAHNAACCAQLMPTAHVVATILLPLQPRFLTKPREPFFRPRPRTLAPAFLKAPSALCTRRFSPAVALAFIVLMHSQPLCK